MKGKHTNTGVLLVTRRALGGYGHRCASRRKASNWGMEEEAESAVYHASRSSNCLACVSFDELSH